MMMMMKMNVGVAVLALFVAADAHECAGRNGGDDFLLTCVASRANIYAIADPVEPLADNMWCAYDRCSEGSSPGCVVLTDGEVDDCIKSGDVDLSRALPILLEDGSEYARYIDDSNMDGLIAGWGVTRVIFPDSRRFNHMRPSRGKAAGCQAWMQIASVANTQPKTFAFDPLNNRCYFFGAGDFPSGTVNVDFGPRNCDCARTPTKETPQPSTELAAEKPAVDGGKVSETGGPPYLQAVINKSLRGQANWVDENGERSLHWKGPGLKGSAMEFVKDNKFIQVSDW